MKIKNRIIGAGHPAYIIAEMSGNHAGSIERAKEIIDNCAHPDYKELLWDYLKIAQKGHTSHRINAALAMHDTLLKKGDMRLTNWADYQ